jgi:OOP family OmpA-OmpF porin|tara:strand:+ start:305 stop:919 length:615 start_codon:yes stop_codon:yes gene_type:complete
MIKMNKVVMLLATAALATAASAQVNNWVSADGTVWKNGTNEFCWRSASWTPATAAVGCDGAIVAAVAPAPVAKPAPAPAPAAVAPVAAPAKVTYAADAFFGFDKAVILPAGKVKLDDLIAKVKDINLEVIVAVGHTDATGPASYNQALSVKRAGAVKAYLVSKGIDANRIYSEGKGETSPVADNSTRSGRSKNRRVEIEVVGAR